MSVPPGDTARSGHCSSGVCALCPRAVGQGATLDEKPHSPRQWGVGRRSGIRTRTPVRAHPFEGCMATVSSSGGTARASSRKARTVPVMYALCGV